MALPKPYYGFHTLQEFPVCYAVSQVGIFVHSPSLFPATQWSVLVRRCYPSWVNYTRGTLKQDTITYIHTYILTDLLTYLLTYSLTPWSRVLLENVTGSLLVKKCETQTFITAFTSGRHLSLSWARSIQSIPPSHFLKIHFTFILSSMPESSKWGKDLRFPHQNPEWTSPTYMLHAPLISSIWSPKKYLVRSINH